MDETPGPCDRVVLNGNDWELAGYYRRELLLAATLETRQAIQPMLPPVPATVPGSVQTDLRAAGVLPDWNVGLNSLACEWVPLREWVYRKRIRVPEDWQGRRIRLEFLGLDYSGRVFLDSHALGEFEGTHLTHRYDVTDRVRPGGEHLLQVHFDQAPELDGQFGMTSQVRLFKPRFGYVWDWCARLVNVGIWDDALLRATGSAWFEDLMLNPGLDADLRTGRLRVRARIAGEAASALRVRVTGPGVPTLERRFRCGTALDVEVAVPGVQSWWPVGLGEQPLYGVTLDLVNADDLALDREQRTVGFRHVAWWPCEGGPPDAIPYRCAVNGRPTFLRGVNWVPLSPFYGTVAREASAERLQQYVTMGCNMLRVWGGAICERHDFYDLCDRLGLMVWQEFPLSSSGYDNWPPEDPEVLDSLEGVAREMVRRRGHHASHVLWCGGNELQGAPDGSKTGVGLPVGYDHPCIQRLHGVVRDLDPGKAFWPTSSSGPRFGADPADFGKGLHHDVHGPWAILPEPYRTSYWWGNDAMLHSEVGAPGCCDLEAQQRYLGDQRLWPPDASNPHWLHHGKWWIPTIVTDVFGEFDFDDPEEARRFLECSQDLQADSYRHAALSARARAGACAGILLWMGHDLFFCTSNNSVLDVEGQPKRAFSALQEVFRPLALGFLPAPETWTEPGRLVGDLVIHDERPAGGRSGQVLLRVAVAGGVAHEEHLRVVWEEGRPLRVPVALTVPNPQGRSMHLRLRLDVAGDGPFEAEYVKRIAAEPRSRGAAA